MGIVGLTGLGSAVKSKKAADSDAFSTQHAVTRNSISKQPKSSSAGDPKASSAQVPAIPAAYEMQAASDEKSTTSAISTTGLTADFLYTRMALKDRGFTITTPDKLKGKYFICRNASGDREYSMLLTMAPNGHIANLDAEFTTTAPKDIKELSRNYFRHIAGLGLPKAELIEAQTWVLQGMELVGGAALDLTKDFGAYRFKLSAPTSNYRRLHITLPSS